MTRTKTLDIIAFMRLSTFVCIYEIIAISRQCSTVQPLIKKGNIHAKLL